MAKVLGERHGFTLTELLAVVAIIVLLTAIVTPRITQKITEGRMHAAENQIAEIETALAAYHADFGAYPGDVFPTEDVNNNGKLDPGEDRGVDVDRDGVLDYACQNDGTGLANNRLDCGDGVINIDDLEWALKTTAKNGPYMESIPLDPWGNRYVYYAPLQRPTNTLDFLYIDFSTLRTEEGVGSGSRVNGKLDGDTTPANGIYTEDAGIGRYATTNPNVNTTDMFTDKWAGADNGILDHGDDDNKNGTIQRNLSAIPPIHLEVGNADISPDGLARNIGYYIYCVGRNGIDETATGYEDINLNSQLDTALTVDGGEFNEDIDGDGTLDTGYEDTGIDGIPGTKDRGEGDWQNRAANPTTTGADPPGTPDEEFGTTSSGPTTWHYNRHHTPGDPDAGGFDIGGDDINSWNKNRPWREHVNYGGEYGGG